MPYSYIKLFDCINSLKETTYSTGQLKIQLKKKGFKNNIIKEKKYLTKTILKSLCDYHENSTPDSELIQLIREINVLIKKRLHNLAIKKLIKAEKLALANEQYDYLLRICSLKTILFRRTYEVSAFKCYMNEQPKQINTYLKYLKNNYEFEQIANKTLLLSSTPSVNGNNKKKLLSLRNSHFFASSKKALTFYGKREYYERHFAISYYTGQHDSLMFKRLEEWVSFLEADKQKLTIRASQYITALSNLLIIYALVKKYSVCELLYNKALKFFQSMSTGKHKIHNEYLFLPLTINYISLRNESGHPEKSITAFETISGIISIQQLQGVLRLALWNNLFISHFLLKNFREALNFTNSILNYHTNNSSEIEIQSEVRLFNLLVHFELKNYEYLIYEAKHTRRFLVKHHCLTAFQKCLISFFGTFYLSAGNKKKEVEKFILLKNELRRLTKLNSQKKTNQEKFNYIAWTDSKIQNRSLLEVLRN